MTETPTAGNVTGTPRWESVRTLEIRLFEESVVIETPACMIGAR